MKRAIQFLANKCGYEIHKQSWFGGRNRLEMMRRIGINFVLDVGANRGTYGAEIRHDGYKGRIWSYEPMRGPFEELSRAAHSDQLWKVINSGCGARAESAEINVAKNSYSSSLLPMLVTHFASAPESEYISRETVSICTLNESVMPVLSSSDKIWLKIDTQGFESEVLKGAELLMPNVEALECELSLVPLYDKQSLIDEMLTIIYRLGFRMVGVSPVFFEPDTGYALQVDGIFTKA